MGDCDSTLSRETDQLFVEQDLPVGPCSTHMVDQGTTQSAHAIVFPLLKKDKLDASQPRNFRPL